MKSSELPKTSGLEVNKHIARAVVRAAAEALGDGFHPDTPAKDYVRVTPDKSKSSTTLFESEQQRSRFDTAMAAAHALLEDEVYEIVAPDEEPRTTGMRPIRVSMWAVDRGGRPTGGAQFSTVVLAMTHQSAVLKAAETAAMSDDVVSRKYFGSAAYVGWFADASENAIGGASTRWTLGFDCAELKSV